MQINANFHTHTTFCDGKNTPREMVLAAIWSGMTHLGFSGHMDADINMEIENYKAEIIRLQKEFEDRIDILCGIELDTLYKPQYAKNIEYVIGSTHFLDVDYERPLSVDDTPEDIVILCNEFFNGDYYQLCKAYYELEATVIDRFPCTIIGHFDLVTKFNNDLHFVDEEDKRYLDSAYSALEYLVSKDVLIEVNTRQSDKGKLYPSIKLLRRIRELDGKVIINSDAHRVNELVKGFNLAIWALCECGFKDYYYLEHYNGTIRRMKKTLSV